MIGILAAGLGTLSTRHPWWCVSLSLLLTTGLALGVRMVRIDDAAWSSDADFRRLQNVEANFGRPPDLSIRLRSDRLFRPSTMKLVERLTDHFRDLPEVADVVSLSTVAVIRKEGRRIFRKPLLPVFPETAESYGLLQKKAVTNPILTNSVLDESGTTTTIHLHFARDARRPGDERNLLSRIRHYLTLEESQLASGDALRLTGPLVASYENKKTIQRDLLVVTSIGVAIVILVLIFHFGTPLAGILPAILGLLTMFATVGFMGICQIPFTILLSVIPVLLFVIGCVEDAHLLSEYARGIRRGQGQEAAIASMTRIVGRPAIFSVLTTLAGLVVLIWHPVLEIRRFGAVASFGLIFNLALTLTLLPALLRIFPVPRAFVGKSGEPFRPLYDRLGQLTLGDSIRRPALLIGIPVLFGVAGLPQLQIGLPFREVILPGTQPDSGEDAVPFYVVIETHREGGVQRPETLGAVARFSKELRHRYESVLSYADIIHRMHQYRSALSRETDPPSLTQGDVVRYTHVLTRRERQRLLDHDASRTLIAIRHLIDNSHEMAVAIEEIETLARTELPPEYTATVTGWVPVFSRFANSLGREFIRDLALVFLAVSLLFAILFRSVRHTILALLPNGIPVVVTLGFMGWAGFWLSTIMYPFVLLILVLAVNDTIHFFTRYFSRPDRYRVPKTAILATLSCELRPVVSTTGALSGGFLALLFASHSLLREVGICVAVGLFLALLCDLVVTPVLLYRADVRNDNEAAAKEMPDLKD